jgi:hypothetical protein
MVWYKITRPSGFSGKQQTYYREATNKEYEKTKKLFENSAKNEGGYWDIKRTNKPKQKKGFLGLW